MRVYVIVYAESLVENYTMPIEYKLGSDSLSQFPMVCQHIGNARNSCGQQTIQHIYNMRASLPIPD